MSLQRECRIVENEPGKWFLLLAQHEHGTLEEGPASATGPFKTSDDAEEYLHDNETNPGGCSIDEYDGHKQNYIVAALIAKARKPESQNDIFARRPYRGF